MFFSQRMSSITRINNHLSIFELGFLNSFSSESLLHSLSLVEFFSWCNKYGAKKYPKNLIQFNFWDDSTLANHKSGKTVEKVSLEQTNWAERRSGASGGGGGGEWIYGQTEVCHFSSQSGTQKFNFHIKLLPKNLSYKILCLLFQQGNYTSLLIYQAKMASSLSQVAEIN